MNKPLSARLSELRKQAGLSQEELADRLGVSRQAVSKWECGDASPDTDNLIRLAQLYGVSLDALVGLDKTQNASPEDPADDPVFLPMHEEKPSSDEDEDEDEEDEDEEDDRERSGGRFGEAWRVTVFSGATIAFFIWGFCGYWHVSWTLFLLAPPLVSLADCFRKKRVSPFLYPVFVTFLYCLLGMLYGLWHPLWILFLTIPVFYAIAGAIDRRNS